MRKERVVKTKEMRRRAVTSLWPQEEGTGAQGATRNSTIAKGKVETRLESRKERNQNNPHLMYFTKEVQAMKAIPKTAKMVKQAHKKERIKIKLVVMKKKWAMTTARLVVFSKTSSIENTQGS